MSKRLLKHIKDKAVTVRCTNEPTYSSIDDLEAKLADLQKELELAEEDTRIVSEINLKKLDHLVKREHEYRNTMGQFEDQLQGKIMSRHISLNPGTLQNMDKITKFHKEINDKLGIVQYKTTQIMIDKERDIVKDYNYQFINIEKDLNNTRSSNIIKLDSAEKKEKKMLEQRETLQRKMIGLEKNHQMLLNRNQNLKLDLKDQENDIENLKFQLELLSLNNMQLKRDLRIQSAQMLDTKKTSPLSTERSRPPKHFSSTSNLLNNPHETDIAALKFKTRQEQEKIRVTKNELSKLLESRQELSSFLRLCIEDVKEKISIHMTNMKQNRSPLTEDQQEKLMEVLLSQERVLTLFHDKAFPPKMLTKNPSSDQDEAYRTNIRGIDGTMEKIEKMYDQYEKVLKNDSLHYQNKSKSILNNKLHA